MPIDPHTPSAPPDLAPPGETVVDVPNPFAGLPAAAVLFDHLPDPVWVFDAREKIVGWNRAAERVYGLLGEHAVGQSALLFVPHDATREFLRAAEAARRHGAWAGDLLTQTATHHPCLVEARWALAGPPGDPAAAVVALHADVTDRRALAEAAGRAARWAATRLVVAALDAAAPAGAVAEQVRAFARGPNPAAEVAVRGTGDRVLVAVADPLLRKLTRALLDGAGYHPLPASDRGVAVRRAAADRDRVRAAVVAFGPDNPAAAAELRGQLPLLQVVAVGDPDGPDSVAVPLPADPARLLRAVAEAVAADRFAEATLFGP